jgi:hypothetical protein
MRERERERNKAVVRSDHGMMIHPATGARVVADT